MESKLRKQIVSGESKGGIGRERKPFDPSDHDSIALLIDLHYNIRLLTLLILTPLPITSLVGTSLKT